MSLFGLFGSGFLLNIFLTASNPLVLSMFVYRLSTSIVAINAPSFALISAILLMKSLVSFRYDLCCFASGAKK